MKKYLLTLVVSLSFLLGARYSLAADANITILKIIDGDTFKIINELGKVETIRVYMIDTPELSEFGWGLQPFALEAKKATSDLCLNKPITIIRKLTDKYSRSDAIVTCDGRDLGDYLVTNGYAWSYHYGLSRIKKEMLVAKDLKLGLWANPNPVDPWAWRKYKMH